MRTVDTPEGCQLDLRVAGLVARARAWLADFAIRALVYLVAVQVLALFDRIGFGLLLLLAFTLEWLYPVYFEAAWHGATPGKRACRLAVLRDDGSPIGWGEAMIRNTLRVVDFLPFFYVAGTISVFLTRDFKRLGDLAAGTVVVYTDLLPPIPALPAEGESDPPPVPLATNEQRAVIGFTLREPLLTRERASELAAYAVPLTAGLAADAARARLVAIGRFLLGRR
ncbi:MAG: RDD family protein [Burkholderiales bacterium]|nr:RDD family protein [Burkholderiales bacterium]